MENDAQFWEDFWTRGVNPGDYFDKECASPAFVHELKGDWAPVGSGAALVPGMGRGYDLEAMARSDRFERVVGIDISERACESARQYLESRSLTRQIHEVVCGDFFNHDFGHQFDLVLDYTFLCALPPAMRPRWAARMSELIKPGGSLITLIFPIVDRDVNEGPPHAVSIKMFHEILEPAGFVAVDGPRMLPDELCHSDRAGKTGYARWKKSEEGQ